MSLDIGVIVLAAPATTAAERAAAADRLGAPPVGSVLLRTCHRVELLGTRATIAAHTGLLREGRPLLGEDAVRHLLRLAVGLESAVVGEDQVLHQLRTAVRAARSQGPLPPALGHLLDQALRQGRSARSWLPARRRSLADVAFDQLDGVDWTSAGVTVVGRGPMGRLLAAAATTRGARPVMTGRDGEPSAGDAVVAVALSGRWVVRPEVAERLVRGDTRVVDLSSPSAVEPSLASRLGARLHVIDDLTADRSSPGLEDERLRVRLEREVGTGLEAYRAWVAAATERDATRLARLAADQVRDHELEALWRRLPDLSNDQRLEIERMAARLAQRVVVG